MQLHNQREESEASIIHPEKTSLNYDVLNKNQVNYKKVIKRWLTHLSASKSVRSNWTVLIEWQVLFEDYSLQKLSSREMKLFFLQVVQTFQKFYGLANIIYASVHFDEEQPHLHIGLIPMKEGRLNSAQIITKCKKTELEAELSLKLEKVLNQNKTAISGSISSRAHSSSTTTDQYLEYKQLYEKIVNKSILPSEIGLKKPEQDKKEMYSKRGRKKNQTIEEYQKENDYLEYLVKQLKAEKNYLLKVLREAETNVEQLEKQLFLNRSTSQKMTKLQQNKYSKKLAEI